MSGHVPKRGLGDFPSLGAEAIMSAVRFTAKQVLEHIFANDSDCDEEAEEEAETFVSRNGQIQGCSVPCDNNRGVGGAAAAAKSNRPVAEVPEDMRPGPTRQAVGQARDILSTFRLFFTPEIEDINLEMTNLEG
ncbi:unnamed protein product, partial [Coregonus sp. 'balchen']